MRAKIAEAGAIIRRGGAVVYPTETVYGIGACALDEKAILRIFEIKERPISRPVFVAVSSFEMLEGVARASESEMALVKRLLPGPVSVLLRKSSLVPDVLTAGSPYVGIRYPDHEMALELISLAGPITSTSANISGRPSPASADEVDPELARRADMVLDGGRSRLAMPSTLVDISARKILRQGAGLEKVLRAI
jgi:L-threonylcarbamoyladenylate synthase